MGRPRETIDAAMLAAAIGVDRLRKGDVGRVVAGDDRAGMLHRDLGAQARGRAVDGFRHVQPVAIDLPLGQGEAAVQGRASAFLDRHGGGVEQKANMRKVVEQSGGGTGAAHRASL